ncbi:MAG: ABA4-like family protein [Pirellulales bacterium]
MTPDLIFTIANNAVLPAWILLAVAPGWKVTTWLVHSAAFSLAIAALYAVTIIPALGSAEGSMFTLAGVQQLFSHPQAVLAGWLHYLAFDLFVGAWEVRNARRLSIPHWQVLPCLFFTLMLGPVGLLIYFVVRFLHGQRTVPADGSAG